jgi:cytochrome c oxidase subunit 7c
MISGTIRRSALAARQAPLVARRNLHATPTRLGGYHYPEGPRSNLPFNPLTRFFAVRYIAFCSMPNTPLPRPRVTEPSMFRSWLRSSFHYSPLAVEEEPVNSRVKWLLWDGGEQKAVRPSGICTIKCIETYGSFMLRADDVLRFVH